MRDKRRHPRYAIPGQNAAGMAIGQRDVIGTLFDISRGGFRFVTFDSVADIHVGAGGVGEFWVGGVMFQGVGKVSHVHATDRKATIGFSFVHDLSSKNKAFSALLSSICDQYNTGTTQIGAHGEEAGMAQVIGHFSGIQAKEIMRLAGAKRIRGIDLSRCNSVDSSGIGISMLASERGLVVRGCKDTVRRLMNTAGMCAKCRSICAK